MIPLIALGVALLPFALWCAFQFGHRTEAGVAEEAQQGKSFLDGALNVSIEDTKYFEKRAERAESELSAAREEIARLHVELSQATKLDVGPDRLAEAREQVKIALAGIDNRDALLREAREQVRRLESIVNDCLTVMAASDDHRERMLAQQMRVALREGKVPG